MNNEFHNIIGFYKKSNNFLIGYLKNDFDLTDNIYETRKFKLKTDLNIIAKSLIDRTYKNNWTEYHDLSRNEYGHLYEKWFIGLKKDDVLYKIIHYENELRKLKLLNLKNK